MTPQRAAKILSDHNDWRRGFTKNQPHPSKDLGEAIEVAIAVLQGKPIKVNRFNPKNP